MAMWFLIINCGCSNLYDSIKPSSPEFLSLHRQQLSFPVYFYRWFIQVISVSTKFNHAFSKKCNFSTNTVEFFYTVEFQMQRSRLLKSAVSHTSMLFADRDFLYGPSKAGKTCIHLFFFGFVFLTLKICWQIFTVLCTTRNDCDPKWNFTRFWIEFLTESSLVHSLESVSW